MDLQADLHIHSTASDGILTPTQIVQTAANIGLAAIAIADHDTTAGIDEAMSEGSRLGVEVVPAIEISTIYENNTEVHMLGYFIDNSNINLQDKLKTLKESRIVRAQQMVKLLNEINIPISFDRVMEIADNAAIGRPHIARAIYEIGAASSINAAFGKYLVEGSPAYVPRFKISPFEAIKLIIESGGVACCAHVAKLKNDMLLLEMMSNGMKAIEVYHPDHGSASKRFYKKFALKNGLIPTGGSDSHGTNSNFGTPIGCVTVPLDVVEKLREARSI